MKAKRMISFSLSMSRIAYLFGAVAETLLKLREKPPYFCEDSSVQVQLERETRIELATLCLGIKSTLNQT